MTLPTIADDDGSGSESEPAWVEKFKSPERTRAAATAAAASSSDDDLRIVDADDGKENEARAAVRDGGGDEDAMGTTTARETGDAAKASEGKTAKALAAKPAAESSSTAVELVATANLGGKSKVLFEIEGTGEAVDLDGDTGAVGRWLAESSRALKVDMKGVMYNARVVSSAGTVVVVAVNADVAKIESVHREFVQLREDPSAMGGMENFGVGSLFDQDEDVDDEDVAVGAKRKRAAETSKASGASARRPATKRKPAQKRKPAVRRKK